MQSTKPLKIKTTSLKPKLNKETSTIINFCGGKGCKHENWLTYPNSAIKGLNSDWVTENILATQRPSSRIITEHDIINQFKEYGFLVSRNGITAILNLQEPGEHPHCGDGILPQSGFSYLPEDFYKHGIYFFNFGWRDMKATSTDLILRIIKQMSFILNNGGKIAVHCHAGRGRTGMIIAAWLIYNENMSAKDAIKLVKTKRKDSISKKSQERVLYELEKGLEQLVSNQKKVLPVIIETEEKYVPKIILASLERLAQLLDSHKSTAKQIVDSFYSLNGEEQFNDEWDDKNEAILKKFQERINNGNITMCGIEDPRYLAQTILDILDDFNTPAINDNFLETILSSLGDSKLTQDNRNQLLKEINKKEFFLIESFAGLFVKMIESDRTLIQELHWAILRICISLTLSKRARDNMFHGRDMIRIELNDEKVDMLKMFIYKVIEYKNDNFPVPTFISQKKAIFNEEPRESRLISRVKRSSLLTKTLIRLTTNNQYNNPKDMKGHKTTPHRVLKPLELHSVDRFHSRMETDESDSSSRWERGNSSFYSHKEQNNRFGNDDYGLYRTEGSEAGDGKEEEGLQVSFSEKEGLPYLVNGAGKYKEPTVRRKDRDNSKLKTLNFSLSRENESFPQIKPNKVEEVNDVISTQTSSNDSSAKLGPQKVNKVNNSRINELASAISQLDEFEQDLLLEKLLEFKQKRQELIN